jgi:hypothetical protein
MDVKAALLYRTLRPLDYTALLNAVNTWMNAEDMTLRHSPSGGETHILFSNPNYHAIISLHTERVDSAFLATALQAPTLGFKDFDYDDAIGAHKMYVAVTVGDGPMHVTPEIRNWMGRMGKHQETTSFPVERKLVALNAIVQQMIQHDVPELVYWAQSDMVYSPEEVAEASDMLFPLPLVVRPMPINAGIGADGNPNIGVRLNGSERFVGRTMVMEPSSLPFAESMGFIMWLTAQRIEGRLMLEHGSGLETPGFPTLYLRHEMPDATDPQGRIVVTQQKPDVYAVTAGYPGMTTLIEPHSPSVQSAPATIMQPAPKAMPMASPYAAAVMSAQMPVSAPPMPAPQHVSPTQPMPLTKAAQPVPQAEPAAQPIQEPVSAPTPRATVNPAPEISAAAANLMQQKTQAPVPSETTAAPVNVTLENPFAEAVAMAESERENVIPLAEAPADTTTDAAPVAASPRVTVGWANGAHRSGFAPKTANNDAPASLSGEGLKSSLKANIPAHHTVDAASALIAEAIPEPVEASFQNPMYSLPIRSVGGALAVVLAITAGLLLAPDNSSTGPDVAAVSSQAQMGVMTSPRLPGQY